MKKYDVLENCHYQGVTYRQGQTVSLREDPKWPERFRPRGETALREANAGTTANQETAQKKPKA